MPWSLPTSLKNKKTNCHSKPVDSDGFKRYILGYPIEDKRIRTTWDDKKEEWYFSVVDVVAVLTDSADPTDYLKKMRKRDELLVNYIGTNCLQKGNSSSRPVDISVLAGIMQLTIANNMLL